jgi:GTP-binding protein HflX
LNQTRSGLDNPEQQKASGSRTRVVCPYLTARSSGADRGPSRSPQARREEAIGLAKAIDLDVIGADTVMLPEIRPATYLGKGKVESIAEAFVAMEAGLQEEKRATQRQWAKREKQNEQVIEVFLGR